MRTLFFGVLATLVISLSSFHDKAKVLVIRIDEAGFVTDGYDTISTDDLAQYIRERLFKNYLGTGKMYDKIRLQHLGENVPTPVLEIVNKEIFNGQRAALLEFCLNKYKKAFDGLDAKQQQKMKKKFPVFFQTDYS